ncbi:hypothetical protein [Nocardioides renjunii]|uniref:hypothetical protein n=1 Tax=Nocardioides renjunii TaxID=3095075 RepID=UPI002AFE94BC|nr:hypothetical protein [Nocardioides sp. S-34]WQQ20887.1 hypothetical protein SHK17_13345 [Nocardioides sp. S-34]
MTDAAGTDPVGSLGEEAAKLFGALSGWAREQVEDAGDGLSDMAAQAAATVHDLDEHLATGSAECTVCPVCRTIHAVRQLDPEVVTHLSSALTSLAQAAASLLSTRPPAQDDASGDERAASDEHADHDDAWPEDA